MNFLLKAFIPGLILLSIFIVIWLFHKEKALSPEQTHLQKSIIVISYVFPESSPFATQNLPSWILSKVGWTRVQYDQAASFLWSQTVALNVQNSCHGDPRPNQIMIAWPGGRS